MSELPASSVFAVLFLISAVDAWAQYLRIDYPDIEQGSARLVVSPAGQALLIDAGTGTKATEDGIEVFINGLIDAGVVASLDFSIANHYDEDHIGRIKNVFQLVPLPRPPSPTTAVNSAASLALSLTETMRLPVASITAPQPRFARRHGQTVDGPIARALLVNACEYGDDKGKRRAFRPCLKGSRSRLLSSSSVTKTQSLKGYHLAAHFA